MSSMTFLKEVRKELKKVEWPTRPEVVKMTGLVIIVSFIVALYIGTIDIAIAQIMKVLVE